MVMKARFVIDIRPSERLTALANYISIILIDELIHINRTFTSDFGWSFFVSCAVALLCLLIGGLFCKE